MAKKKAGKPVTKVRKFRDLWTGLLVEDTKKERDRIERRVQRKLRESRTPYSRTSHRASKASAMKPAVKGPVLRDPWTGRFAENTKKEADRIERRAQRELRESRVKRSRAFRKVQAGAKKPETRQRYAEQYQDAAAKADAAMLRAGKAKKELEKVSAAKGVSRVKAPAQWEFGVGYVAGRRDRSHDVNFNIRLRRKDQQGIPREEAVRAIERIAEGGAGAVRKEYIVYSVEWTRARGKTERGSSRWSKNVQQGSADDVDSFQSILMETIFERNGEGLRMGAVREETDWLESESDE